MDLKTLIENMERRRSIAKAAGTTADYLWQIATGWNGRKPSPQLARRISEATHGLVTLADLRPDVYGAASNDDKA